MISNGFRWFAVLVVTRIHNIQKSYFFTILRNAHDWLRSFYFFIQSKTARKRLLLSCRLAVRKWVIISYTLLCCISNQKLFLNENSHKTQSKWSIANYLRQGVLAGNVWKLFKSKENIRANGETERIQPNGEISSSDGERRQVCKMVPCNVLSHSQKLYTAIKEECVIS